MVPGAMPSFEMLLLLQEPGRWEGVGILEGVLLGALPPVLVHLRKKEPRSKVFFGLIVLCAGLIVHETLLEPLRVRAFGNGIYGGCFAGALWAATVALSDLVFERPVWAIVTGLIHSAFWFLCGSFVCIEYRGPGWLFWLVVLGLLPTWPICFFIVHRLKLGALRRTSNRVLCFVVLSLQLVILASLRIAFSIAH